MKEKMPDLRDEIARLDRALLELLESRFQLAARVGRLKAERGQPVVVPEVEQRVLARAREAASLCETSPEVMESILICILKLRCRSAEAARLHRLQTEILRHPPSSSTWFSRGRANTRSRNCSTKST